MVVGDGGDDLLLFLFFTMYIRPSRDTFASLTFTYI